MSSKRTVGYVLLFIIVVAVLVGGGYALYRLGYLQGLQASDQIPFRGRFDQDFHHRFQPGFMTWRGRIGFSPLQFFPGLFSTLGFLALIALAIIGFVGLIQRRQVNDKRQAEAIPPHSTTQDEA
jgi:hypothetical protein